MNLFYPEMGETPPIETQIFASLAHYGEHWFLSTPLRLKGLGITHRRTLVASELTPAAQHKAGWHEYLVTERAFRKLETQYAIAVEALL